MKRARVIVLGIAFTAALGAAWVAKKIVSGPREVETVEKTVGATDVLVACHQHQSRRFGECRGSEMAAMAGRRRHSGPHHPRRTARCADQAVRRRGPRAVHRRRADQGAEADQDFGGRRDGGHPAVRHARHLHADPRGDLGRRLHPAQRSRRRHLVAQASTSAPRRSPVSEAVLRNVRVLAIGQEIEIKDGDKVATGKTATLELTPPQAETLALAQSMGELSLSLRSLADSTPGQAETTAKIGDTNSSSVKISEIRRALARLRRQLRSRPGRIRKKANGCVASHLSLKLVPRGVCRLARSAWRHARRRRHGLSQQHRSYLRIADTGGGIRSKSRSGPEQVDDRRAAARRARGHGVQPGADRRRAANLHARLFDRQGRGGSQHHFHRQGRPASRDSRGHDRARSYRPGRVLLNRLIRGAQHPRSDASAAASCSPAPCKARSMPPAPARSPRRLSASTRMLRRTTAPPARQAASAYGSARTSSQTTSTPRPRAV